MDKQKREEIISALQKAYWMEMESVMNYLAHSVNMDGIMAEEIKEILSREVSDESKHAKKIARRIKDLDGTVEGSMAFNAKQESAQPPSDTTDLESVVSGVIDAEKSAIEQYQHIIDMTDGVDYVTQDLCIHLLSDEEKHLRIFRGFLRGLKKEAEISY